MPNSFAYLMLLVWPIVVAVLFRRMRVERAFIWSILGGYLLLPPVADIDLPLIPSLDKHSIPALAAFIALWMHQGRLPQLMPQSTVAKIILGIFLLSGVGTVFTNSDPVVRGVVYLPALPLSEAFVSIVSQFLAVLPMLMAQHLLKRPEHVREIVLAMVIAGLLYSVPMLLEIRLSPQLNVWVYGFFQAYFEQMVRYSGYRPMVFLQHGLWVAFFAFMAAAAALSMLQNESDQRGRYFVAAAYLTVVLVLCKSASALIYMIAFAPLVLLVSRRTQIRIAAAMAAVVILYPLLRGAGLIPTDAIAAQAASMDAERSRSLVFRLMNEDLLLDHAAQRPFFGWGGWDRNHLHDPLSGRTLTVTDGLWIATIGSKGWMGYLGLFGLLTLPLFALAMRARSKSAAITPYVAALAIILGANLIDLIPNATLIPFSWLIAGALLGYAGLNETAPPPDKRPPDKKDTAPWARAREPAT